jgi:hypothetical protein
MSTWPTREDLGMAEPTDRSADEPESIEEMTFTYNPREASEDDRWERLRTEGATLLDRNGKAVGIVLPSTSDEDPFAASFIPDPFYDAKD